MMPPKGGIFVYILSVSLIMRLALVFTLLLFSIVGIAQQNNQTLIFRNNNGNQVRAFRFPLRMICYFKSGKSQQLILESIQNDTLIFRKYYNQDNYDCTVNTISCIKVNDTRKKIMNAKIVTAGGATIFFGFVSAIGLVSGSFGTLSAVFYGIPLTLLSSVLSIAAADALPFNFYTDAWTLYVK